MSDDENEETQKGIGEYIDTIANSVVSEGNAFLSTLLFCIFRES